MVDVKEKLETIKIGIYEALSDKYGTGLLGKSVGGGGKVKSSSWIWPRRARE